MSRGIRNNNPGNIRVGAKWQGRAAKHEMTPEQKREEAFVVFQSPEWGIRAIVKILQTYQRVHGIDTVQGIISRWAPPSENITGSYVRAVTRALNVASDTPLVLGTHTLKLLVTAIIQHENGEQPYSNATLLAGIALSGLTPPKPKPVISSKRLKGGLMVGGAVTVLTQVQMIIDAARFTVASIIPVTAAPNTGWYLAIVLGTALGSFGLYIGWTILMDYMGQSEPEVAER